MIWKFWKLIWTGLNSLVHWEFGMTQVLTKSIPIHKNSSLTCIRAYHSYLIDLHGTVPRSLHVLWVESSRFVSRSRGICSFSSLSQRASSSFIHFNRLAFIFSPPLKLSTTKLQILVIPCGDCPWERLEKIKLLPIQALLVKP